MKEQILNLIAKDKIEEAFELLFEFYAGDDRKNEILVLSGKFSELQKKDRLGIIDSKEFDLHKNKIRYSIIQALELKDKQNNLVEKAITENQEFDDDDLSLNNWFKTNKKSLWNRILKIFEDKS